MNFGLVFFINSILLGVGLAMDAFSVSLANGLNEPKMPKHRMALIAGVFALFQAAMPMTGWLCVHTVVEYFSSFEKFIPYIALILLSYIGGKMLYDGIKGEDCDSSQCTRLTLSALLIQGIATSIDALSVGFTISDYDLITAIICALIIAAVTFVICIGGLLIGRKFGTKLGSKATVLGGVILIGIGIEIFVTGIL